jgi:hypothetical protein
LLWAKQHLDIFYVSTLDFPNPVIVLWVQ